MSIEPFDIRVSSGGVDEMTMVLTRVGPLGKSLRENPSIAPIAVPIVRAATAQIAGDGDTALTAATWIVSATGKKT